MSATQYKRYFGTILTVGLVVAVGAVMWFQSPRQAQAAAEVAVYKSATCGCCEDWITHLQTAGFKVVAHVREDMNVIKAQYGVLPQLSSCHTAIVDGYVIEGHVPADDIKRLLSERPVVGGLAAPGMPQKSPGMQAEGLSPKGYDVLAFDKTGKTRVFAKYP